MFKLSISRHLDLLKTLFLWWQGNLFELESRFSMPYYPLTIVGTIKLKFWISSLRLCSTKLWWYGHSHQQWKVAFHISSAFSSIDAKGIVSIAPAVTLIKYSLAKRNGAFSRSIVVIWFEINGEKDRCKKLPIVCWFFYVDSHICLNNPLCWLLRLYHHLFILPTHAW